MNTDLIKIFFAKAGCIYTQAKARHIWNEIKNNFSIEQRRAISIAWEHFLMGEGRGELDFLYKKYKKRIINDL